MSTWCWNIGHTWQNEADVPASITVATDVTYCSWAKARARHLLEQGTPLAAPNHSSVPARLAAGAVPAVTASNRKIYTAAEDVTEAARFMGEPIFLMSR